MKNLKIKILIGIPASGKSTWCTEFLRQNPDWIRVNRDYFRLMLRNEQMCEPKIEDLITTLVNKTIHAALNKKLNVIVDATNVKVKYVQEFIDEFKYDADIDYQVFDISVDKAIERDKNRTAMVGEDVIKRMYKDFKIFMDTFHFQPVTKIERRPIIQPKWNSNLPDAVIFDIDGTIALMGKRGPFDWDKVFVDDCNGIVTEHIKLHWDRGRNILLVSGRDDICRKDTEEWLDFYGIQYDKLFMRPENDYRKDTIVKKEIYDNHIKDKYNIIAVYDDRLQVLDMWHKEGLYTFNVNQGNIEF